mgnify:FL=1
MPIPGARYRVVTRGGKKVRLAFKGKGKVVEAKNLETGATHTPAEFGRDEAKSSVVQNMLRSSGARNSRE